MLHVQKDYGTLQSARLPEISTPQMSENSPESRTRAALLNSHTGLKDPQRSEWMPAVVQPAGAQTGVPRRLAQALTAGGLRGTEWPPYCLWKQSGAVLCVGSGQWFGVVCASEAWT